MPALLPPCNVPARASVSAIRAEQNFVLITTHTHALVAGEAEAGAAACTIRDWASVMRCRPLVCTEFCDVQPRYAIPPIVYSSGREYVPFAGPDAGSGMADLCAVIGNGGMHRIAITASSS